MVQPHSRTLVCAARQLAAGLLGLVPAGARPRLLCLLEAAALGAAPAMSGAHRVPPPLARALGVRELRAARHCHSHCHSQAGAAR